MPLSHCILGLLLSLPLPAAAGRSDIKNECPAAVVDASTAKGKLLMGYQGWFAAPKDGSQTDRWLHWFRGQAPDHTQATVDMLPDVSELEPDELFSTGMKTAGGRSIQVFSAHNAKTVARHFQWMKDYGLDGVLLQRFVSELSDPKFLALRDQVLRNVMQGAEKNGRVFGMMYDLSGSHEALALVEKDWKHLVDDLGMTKSPRYLRHKGKPLLALWGFGFADRPGEPAQVLKLLDSLKKHPDPKYRATLLGGVPTEWRTLGGGSKTEPEWAKVYRSFDIISPWTVGRYGDIEGADRYRKKTLEPDLAEAAKAGIEYMPVVFPGFSWTNLTKGRDPLNAIRRMGGALYWRQVHNALDAGATMVYGAMFDEVDEGTAMFKMVHRSSQLPSKGAFLPLDADGYPLPSDWYLRIASLANRAVAGKYVAPPFLPLDPNRPVTSERLFDCGSDKKDIGAGLPAPGLAISVNFMGGSNSNGFPEPMAPAESAGAVKVAHWNNADGHMGRLPGLKDSRGAASGAKLSWESVNVWSTPAQDKPGDFRMMKGYLDTSDASTTEITVEGLPKAFRAAGYKVIVYFDGDSGEALRKAKYSIGSKSLVGTDPPRSFFRGAFAQAGDWENFVVFDGLKDESFTLKAKPYESSTGQFRAPVNALQIVAAGKP